jgi:hypothetical protein
VLFAAGASPLTRDPVNFLAHCNGGLADSLGMIADPFLALGVLHYRLGAPRFHSDDATVVADS